MGLTTESDRLSTAVDGAQVRGYRTAVPLPGPPCRPILRRMKDVTVRRNRGRTARVLAAIPLALLLLAVTAGSALGAATLTNPSVSPTTAIFGSTVTFKVTFTDSANVAPTYVRAYTDTALTVSKAVTLTATGSTWTTGVVYTGSTSTLAIGTYPIIFRARDNAGNHPQLAAITLTITPAPTPTATPRPKSAKPNIPLKVTMYPHSAYMSVPR